MKSNADLGQAGLAGANLAGTILKDAYLVGPISPEPTWISSITSHARPI
jgi:uncharacterized protein YjbI with pentapeptide repeats